MNVICVEVGHIECTASTRKCGVTCGTVLLNAANLGGLLRACDNKLVAFADGCAAQCASDNCSCARDCEHAIDKQAR